jgi:predicted DNA-binding transcriptional regulator AlpA
MDKIISFQEFATISGMQKKNVSQLLWKSPNLMPPVVREPGRKPYFLESDVNAWIEAKKAYRVVAEIKRGRGRPRKHPTTDGEVK